jgi:cell division protein FtsA
MLKASSSTHPRLPDVFGVVDIGTAKVAAAILARDLKAPPLPNGLAGYRLAGFGSARARGLKASVIVDLDQAQAALQQAVETAEAQARVTLDSVTVAVPSGRLKGSTIAAAADLAMGKVTDAELARLARAGDAYASRDSRRLLHMNPIAYRIDGGHSIADPRGMAGQRIAADIHVASADDTPVRHLIQVVEGADLGIDKLVPTPLASALAGATVDERRQGAIVIDFGAGSTTLALYAEGHLVGLAAIPVGANHLTYDLSRSLGLSIPEAERIKTNYGTLVRTQADAHRAISLSTPAREGSAQAELGRVITVADVREILAARAGTLMAMVRERIEASGVPLEAFQCVVMTGGGSRLTGFVATVSRALERPTRLAEPQISVGLADTLRVPEFATVSGLIEAALLPSVGIRLDRPRETADQGYLGRLGQWFRESF